MTVTRNKKGINETIRDYVKSLEAELSATKEKLELAEKRIRESQEQEPTVYVKFWARQRLCGHEVDCDEGLEVCRKGECGDDGVLAAPLYIMPPIPPELEALQKENAELRKQLGAVTGAYKENLKKHSKL